MMEKYLGDLREEINKRSTRRADLKKQLEANDKKLDDLYLVLEKLES